MCDTKNLVNIVEIIQKLRYVNILKNMQCHQRRDSQEKTSFLCKITIPNIPQNCVRFISDKKSFRHILLVLIKKLIKESEKSIVYFMFLIINMYNIQYQFQRMIKLLAVNCEFKLRTVFYIVFQKIFRIKEFSNLVQLHKLFVDFFVRFLFTRVTFFKKIIKIWSKKLCIYDSL